MTGHGEAVASCDDATVTVDLRTINNRFFKLNLRITEGYNALEPRIEAAVRKHVKRGTVHINLRIDRKALPEDFRLNLVALQSYQQQLRQVDPAFSDIAALTALPGVVVEGASGALNIDRSWPLVEQAIEEAAVGLQQMRGSEGRAMAEDMKGNFATLLLELDEVAQRAPLVVEGYRSRLTDRLKKLLSDQGQDVDPATIVREVGFFAERADISEEIARLRSHLEQFAEIVALPESNGKKLDFLTQELNRETNTIGSKSNDAEIARRVVEMKTAIERIREMVQNIE